MSWISLVCYRNAQSATTSTIKISAEKMCFLATEKYCEWKAENTSLRWKCWPVAQWAAAQARVTSLFLISAHFKVHKMEQISKVKVALLQADALGSKSQSSRPTLHCFLKHTKKENKLWKAKQTPSLLIQGSHAICLSLFVSQFDFLFAFSFCCILFKLWISEANEIGPGP